MDSQTIEIPDYEARLCGMAAKLLAVAFSASDRGSSADDIATAKRLHDEGKLYPKLTVASPHNGNAVRIELVLHDPMDDAPVISLLTIETEPAQLC